MRPSIHLFWLALLLAGPAQALPLFSAREGRTCDNCHTDPTGWPDPERVQIRHGGLSP